MSKTFFDRVSEGRLPSPEKIDPFKVVISGLAGPDEKETARISAIDAECAVEMAKCCKADSNRELAELLKDPDKFLSSYRVAERRVYVLHLMIDILTVGQLQEVIVAQIGDAYVATEGRHRVVVIRLLREVFQGKRDIAQIRDLVMKLRAERGADWLPVLKAKSPPKGVDLAHIADASNSLRLVATTEEIYDRCLQRIHAAHVNESEPDYEGIARGLGLESGNLVKSYEKLSKMHPTVRKYVLVGDENGHKFPVNSALQFAALSHTEQLAKVEGMLKAGDTRVATAKATAAEAKGDSGKGSRRSKRGDGEGGRSESSRESKSEEPSDGKVYRAPWGVRDFLKFCEANRDKLPTQLAAIERLMRHGPDKLDATYTFAVPGLADYLKGESEKK